jgi:hypothetical protein
VLARFALAAYLASQLYHDGESSIARPESDG